MAKVGFLLEIKYKGLHVNWLQKGNGQLLVAATSIDRAKYGFSRSSQIVFAENSKQNTHNKIVFIYNFRPVDLTAL
jgi:hypothetical protein